MDTERERSIGIFGNTSDPIERAIEPSSEQSAEERQAPYFPFHTSNCHNKWKAVSHRRESKGELHLHSRMLLALLLTPWTDVLLLLLLTLAAGQPACCILDFGRRWTRCWHPAPRALLMTPAIRGPCVLEAAPLFW